MSGKRAKAERKEKKEEQPQASELGNHLFDVTISIYDTGKFELAAPKGASIPLALDCCMRATHQLWSMIVQKFSQKQQTPMIVPGRMGDIDILQKIKAGRA